MINKQERVQISIRRHWTHCIVTNVHREDILQNSSPSKKMKKTDAMEKNENWRKKKRKRGKGRKQGEKGRKVEK